MGFEEVLDRVDGRRRRLVFYNVEDHEPTEPIIDYVGVHDVIIEYATDEGVPPSSVAVRRGNETLAVDDIEAVSNYITAWEAGLASHCCFQPSTRRSFAPRTNANSCSPHG